MNRLFAAAMLGALLTVSAYADITDDKKAFKEAYVEYQKAIKNNEPLKAVEPAKRAYELGRKIYGDAHKNTAALAFNYGRILRTDEAPKILGEALEVYKKIYGEEAIELVDPLMALAAKKAEYIELSIAQRYYGEALKIVEKEVGKDSMLAGEINLEVGQIALSQAQSRYAISYFKRAREIFTGHTGDIAKIDLAMTDFWIGKFRMATDAYESATESLLESLKTFEELTPTANVTKMNHAFLVESYERRGMRDEATKHCHAIGLAEASNPDQDYQPVFKFQPEYSRSTRKADKEAFVVVSLTVDKDGFVSKPKVVEHKGSDSFVEASLEAVQKFRYAPRFKNGKPVKTKDVTYRFSNNLDD